MEVLAGGIWRDPRGYEVVADFKKNKRRGRLNTCERVLMQPAEQCFPSEGSGRISSISWSDGLVEIGFEEELIAPGTVVRYIPYAEFLRPSQSTDP